MLLKIVREVSVRRLVEFSVFILGGILISFLVPYISGVILSTALLVASMVSVVAGAFLLLVTAYLSFLRLYVNFERYDSKKQLKKFSMLNWKEVKSE